MTGNELHEVAAYLAGPMCGLPEPKPEVITLWRARLHLLYSEPHRWNGADAPALRKAFGIVEQKIVSIVRTAVAE